MLSGLQARRDWFRKMTTRYFHGGAPGRRMGDLLLPSARTGYQNSHFRGQLLKNYDPQRVYIATDQELAIRYASVFPGLQVLNAPPQFGVLSVPSVCW